VFQSVYRHELETKLSQKTMEAKNSQNTRLVKKKGGCRISTMRRSGHDCLATHLYRIAIRPDPSCTLCSLREPMDRNHLRQCTALFNRTECERYWEARTQMIVNWLCSFFITIFCDYSLLLGLLYLLWMFPFFCIYSVIVTFYLYLSHTSLIMYLPLRK